MASPGTVDKAELIDQVKQQIAVANAQELLSQMTTKCFKKCIGKPGTSLDSSEQVRTLSDLNSVSKDLRLSYNAYVFVSTRNVYPCVWIVSWTHGILSPEPTARGYSVSNQKCEQDKLKISLPMTMLCS